MTESPFPIILHINYFEQGQTLERACAIARDLGADGIEFRRKPAKFSGSDLDYLDEVSRAIDKHPLDWISFGSPGVDFMTSETSAREANLQAAEAFFRKAASRFPLRIINSFTGRLANPDQTLPQVEYWHHGSAVATDEQWIAAVEGFQRLAQVAKELKFRIAFETHGLTLHDTVESTVRLVDEIASEQIGILWDHANLLLFQNYPSTDEAIQQMRKKLYYVHLKNLLVPASRFLAISSLSGGIINIRQQVQELLQSGYRGPIAIESPREGDREHFAKEDITYLKEIIRCLSSSLQGA